MTNDGTSIYLTRDRGGFCLWPQLPVWSAEDKLYVEPDGQELENISLEPKQAKTLLGKEMDMNTCVQVMGLVSA